MGADHGVGLGEVLAWRVVVDVGDPDGPHPDRLCPRDVRPAKVADVDGLVGLDVDGLEGGSEHPGVGLGDADLVREGEELEVLGEIVLLEEGAHHPSGGEARVADEGRADARLAEGAEGVRGHPRGP